MKKPERLVGFVEYEATQFPFEFDERSFSIFLYPPDKKALDGCTNPIRFFSSSIKTSQEHEWVQQKRLSGTTSEKYQIVFDIQDSPSNYHGFISFQVNWYLYFRNVDIDSVIGFRITGNVVNYFYPPETAIKAEVEFNENGRNVKKIAVNSTEYKKVSCGEYRVSDKIDATIEAAAYASIHYDNALSPIEATSILTMGFSAPVGLDILLNSYDNTRLFFEYITYRHNVILGDVEVLFLNKQEKKEYGGVLVFPAEFAEESNKKVKQRIIKYSLLSTKAAKLFNAINNNAFEFQSICGSIGETNRYSSSRIIMIFTEFEREYRNIFGQDFGRSDEYLEIKQAVVDLIDQYEKSQHGKRRRYANQLKNYVDKRDSSFEANIKKALTDCEPILSGFARKRYEETYPVVVDGIAERMGIIRNGIAHSHIDLYFDAVHLSDIKIIEELIYAMRLKEIGLTDEECQKAINDLFGENFG